MVKPWPFAMLMLVSVAPAMSAETYSYPLSAIESVAISAGIEFQIQCADTEIVEIEAESEQSFELRIKNNKLELSRKSRFPFFFSGGSVTANIKLKKSPQSLAVSAGSHGEMEGCFEDNASLTAALYAGSSVDLRNNTGPIHLVEVEISSGSRLGLEGDFHISRLNLTASSGASLETDNNVIIDKVHVNVSSGASTDLCGAASIDGSASSGGHIKISEAATHKVKTSSGGGVRTRCK